MEERERRESGERERESGGESCSTVAKIELDIQHFCFNSFRV